jgi:hypothetical protein
VVRNQDPVCKTAVNWVAKSIRQWETKIANPKVMPLAIWPIVKSLIKRDRTKAPNTVHGPLGLKFQPLKKVDRTADYFEKTVHAP